MGSTRICCHTTVLIAAVCIGYILNFLYRAGAFKSIGPDQEHGNTECEILTNSNSLLIGCEDIAQFNDGTVILSCANRTMLEKEMFSPKSLQQVIEENSYSYPGYLFSMINMHSTISDETQFAEIQLIGRQSPDFSPHGIGLITDALGEHRIYLINHRRDGDVVEIFKLSADRKIAIFDQEVRSPLFVFINDLKPVLLDSTSNLIGFYVTNTFGWPLKSKMNVMESTLALQQCDLIFCAPDLVQYEDRYNKRFGEESQFEPQWKCRVAASNLAFGNGVEVSVDGQTVYAVESTAARISVFDRNVNENTLTKRDEIPIVGLPDNLHLDRNTGDLYIGTHPNVAQLLMHQMNGARTAPSQVLHWCRETGRVEEILLSNGHTANHVSGSSVGVFEQKTRTLLVGTVNDGTMRCKI